jgi:GNAT superfamily N-acetyltransferase
LTERVELSIRPLGPADSAAIAAPFMALGWNVSANRFEPYRAEQERGERVVLLAEVGRDLVGYVTVHWESNYDPFRRESIPEIEDLNVLPDWRRRGIASRLLDEAEARISERSAVAGIGVGMDEGYGPAQRLYVLRGYVPDGRGLTYERKRLRWGDTTRVDDELILMLTKQLRD